MAGNTYSIMQAIQSKCQGLQVSGSTFFQASSVIIGTFPDIRDLTPTCEITQSDDLTQRMTTGNGAILGGKIDDSQLFFIEICLDLTNKQTAEQNLAGIRDSLTTAFHASAQLATLGVRYSGLEGHGKRSYIFRNGQWWRYYKQLLRVRYEYAVQVVP